MKTEINKSAKRALSLVIAFALLIGSLFTANVGVNIKANAETVDVSNLKISYWDGTFEKTSNFSNYTYDSATGALTGGTGTVLDTAILNETGATGKTANDPIIIDDAKELATLVRYGTYQNTAGLYFKLSDKLDVIILQPENVVDAAELMSLSSGEETKAFFDNHANKAQFVDWGALCDSGTFAGSFNGNGVEIYGLWMDPTANNGYGRQHGGLFGATDPGVLGSIKYNETGGAYTSNDAGVTYQNIIIKNSYYFGFRRMGAIIPSTNGKTYGCSASGIYNIKNCIVGNCFMECTGYNGKDDYSVNANGILMGGSDPEDTPIVTNCLVYGNVAENKVDEYNEGTSEMAGPFSLVGQCNTYTNTSSVTIKPSISKTVAIGSPACVFNYRTTADICTNVYSTANYYSTPGVTSMYDAETLKGATAMAWASALDWGTDWFAVEGGLPTPIEPTTYIPVSQKPTSLYESGDGTKEKPYIIRTVDQLNKMVTEESYSGTYADSHNDVWVTDYATNTLVQKDMSITSYYSKYYKVDDGIDALYINDVETQEDANALYTANSYNKWTPASIFAGNFDGNGVTIYGLIGSSSFVKKIDGTHAAIKNVHFKAAHIESTYAAVVATDFGSYGYGYRTENNTALDTIWFNREVHPTTGESVNRWLISNISVTESYIKSSLGSETGYTATAGGIIALNTTPAYIIVRDCLFDGVSSTLVDAMGTNAGVSATSMKAGIASISHDGSTNRWEFSNCVSINEYPVSMKTGGTYKRFTEDSGGGSCEIKTMYGSVNTAVDTAEYPKFSAVLALEETNFYTASNAPLLDWATTWKIVDVEFDTEGNATRSIPMPVGLASENSSSYTQLIMDNDDTKLGRPYYGNFGFFYDLTGSGTQDDPYLITNALELARAIACGGKNLDEKLYYKLTCDIDLSGTTWIDQSEVEGQYSYVPFEGTLDGAGHTITGLAAIDNAGAGLVPVLNGGTIKNVHIRNSYAGSATANSAGLIAGVVNEGSTIQNCSVEGSTAVNSKNNALIIGDLENASTCVTNSYFVADGAQSFSSDITDSSALTIYPATNAAWYKGPDGVARHIAAAKAHTVTDVDGDGIFGDIYTSNDLVALRNNLLGQPDYANIYGDVSNDGKTNISDLAILRREMADTYNNFKDGFWRNAELGMVKIYYAENDTQDMARKLELYLEAALQYKGKPVDIIKVPGTAVTDNSIAADEKSNYVAGTQNAIVITKTLGTIADDAATATYDDYYVTFDAENHIIKINGGSFTAVEQAVLDLIASGYIENNTDLAACTNISGSILSNTAKYTSRDGSETITDKYMKARQVVDENGKSTYYHYAWGDEFESDSKTSFSRDNWNLVEYRTETDVTDTKASNFGTTTETGYYLNLESANVKDTNNLWVVNDGRLTINRGIRSDKASSYTGYVSVDLETGTTNDYGSYIDENDIYVDPGLIKTWGTMLFKYGYAEMRASLPSDGHAFPAWWILTGPGSRTNSGIESTLYDKVYTLNNIDNAYENNASLAYDGVSNDMNGSILSTYKYQIPAAHLEFDIVELMQAQNGSSWGSAVKTGNYIDYFQPTVHKIYTSNVYNNATGAVETDDVLYLPMWKAGTYQTWDTYSNVTVDNQSTFKFTSANDKPYLNNYQHSGYNSLYPYTTVSRTGFIAQTYSKSIKDGSFSTSMALAGVKGNELTADSTSYNTWNSSSTSFDHKNLQKYFTYGFTWEATSTTYTLAIYCDLDEDGIMEANANEKIFEINEKTGYDTTTFGADPTYNNDYNGDGVKDDAAMWNQYGYILLDNAFYTSNNYGSKSTQYTDLQVESGDKITFDIDYMRVYQEDGKRDIVTYETEDFNNGNHFGY